MEGGGNASPTTSFGEGDNNTFHKYSESPTPGENIKRSTSRKKENEVNNVNMYNKSLSRQESNSRPNTEKLQFIPIPMTYRELYQNLFDTHVVSLLYLKPMQPSFPKWYDANA
ncbi:hypothetical protein EPI10_002618 [Gossypium australe]|uniref:Uncharacterized protein n=1 Tax=Gossypium australe TaxID=47621 RepID=A0A5B6VEV3_9ROSI|nr:hypothetical protein EPI10_002618 [Gossypium australe]